MIWQRALALGIVLIAAFLVGRATAPEGIGEAQLEAAEAALERAEREAETLELAVIARRQAQTSEPSPAATDEPAATETAASGKRVYVVQSGDTMRGIAQTFCGDPDLAEFVASYNDLDDPRLISIGMELKLPDDCDL